MFFSQRWKLFRLLGVVIIGGGPFLAFSADVGEVRELDIVVTTNLKSTKEHATEYVNFLRSEVENAFVGLNPLTYEDGKAKAGAARHRLVVEHNGTVTLGSTLLVRAGFPKADFKTFQNGNRVTFVIGKDVTYHQTTWYLAGQQEGTLSFKLLKWDNQTYKVLDTWTIAVPKQQVFVDEYRGLIPVADLIQDSKKAPINFNPKCPKTLAEAKQEALKMLLPGSFPVANRLVKGKLLKVARNESEVDFEVLIENKSPWPVKKVRVDAFTMGAVLLGELEFPNAILAGKSAKGRATCTPEMPETNRTPGVRVYEVEFAVKE